MSNLDSIIFGGEEEPSFWDDVKDTASNFGSWLAGDTDPLFDIYKDEARKNIEAMDQAGIEDWKDTDLPREQRVASFAENMMRQGVTEPEDMAKHWSKAFGEDTISDADMDVLNYYAANRDINPFRTTGQRVLHSAADTLAGIPASLSGTVGGISQLAGDAINLVDEDNAVADTLHKFGTKASALGEAQSEYYKDKYDSPISSKGLTDIGTLLASPAKFKLLKPGVSTGFNLLKNSINYAIPSAAMDYGYTRSLGGDKTTAARNALFGGTVGGTVGPIADLITGNYTKLFSPNDIRAAADKYAQGDRGLRKGLIFDDMDDYITKISNDISVNKPKLLRDTANLMETQQNPNMPYRGVLNRAIMSQTKRAPRASNYLDEAYLKNNDVAGKLVREADERTRDTIGASMRSWPQRTAMTEATRYTGPETVATDWDKAANLMELEEGVSPVSQRTRAYSGVDDIGITRSMQNKGLTQENNPATMAGSKSSVSAGTSALGLTALFRALGRQLPFIMRQERVVNAIKNSILKDDFTPGPIVNELKKAGMSTEDAVKTTRIMEDFKEGKLEPEGEGPIVPEDESNAYTPKPKEYYTDPAVKEAMDAEARGEPLFKPSNEAKAESSSPTVKSEIQNTVDDLVEKARKNKKTLPLNKPFNKDAYEAAQNSGNYKWWKQEFDDKTGLAGNDIYNYLTRNFEGLDKESAQAITEDIMSSDNIPKAFKMATGKSTKSLNDFVRKNVYPDQNIYSFGTGLTAGIETDDKGNITYDPVKGVLGGLGGAAIGSVITTNPKRISSLIDKFGADRVLGEKAGQLVESGRGANSLLGEAGSLIKAGKTPEEIYEKTGVQLINKEPAGGLKDMYKEMDIDRLRDSVQGFKNRGDAFNTIDNNKLFSKDLLDVYPEFKNNMTVLDRTIPYKGYLDRTSNTININPSGDFRDTLDTTFHEFSHIDNSGAPPSAIAAEATNIGDSLANRLGRRLDLTPSQTSVLSKSIEDSLNEIKLTNLDDLENLLYSLPKDKSEEVLRYLNSLGLERLYSGEIGEGKASLSGFMGTEDYFNRTNKSRLFGDKLRDYETDKTFYGGYKPLIEDIGKSIEENVPGYLFSAKGQISATK